MAEIKKEVLAVLIGLAANDFLDVVVKELNIKSAVISKTVHFALVISLAVVFYQVMIKTHGQKLAT